MADENEEETTTETIELSHFGVITVRADGSGTISGPLIWDEDEGGERPEGWEQDPFHAAVDALFGLALLHALAGIDVGGRPYERGFEQQLSELQETYGGD